MKIEQKKDILKGCNLLFQSRESLGDKDKISEKDYQGIMDPANVCMIVPKTKSFKRFLLDTFDVDFVKFPELDYKVGSKEPGEICSKYASEYLKIVLGMTKRYESIIIKTKKEYPLWAECEDFIFILAPRVGGDE